MHSLLAAQRLHERESPRPSSGLQASACVRVLEGGGGGGAGERLGARHPQVNSVLAVYRFIGVWQQESGKGPRVENTTSMAVSVTASLQLRRLCAPA